MPSNARLMIHNPWAFVEGDADTMRKAASMLDKHRDSMVAVYRNKTGATADQVKQWMDEETWFSAAEAASAKFCDKVTGEVSFSACFDMSKFRHVPKLLGAKQKNTGEDNMKRTAIIAKLRQLGIQFDETASTEALMSLLPQSEYSEPAKAKDAGQANGNSKAKKEVKEGKAEEDEDESEESEESEEMPMHNRSRETPRRDINRIQNKPRSQRSQEDADAAKAQDERLAKLEASYEGERKARISAVVDRCISEDRVPMAQRDRWLTRAMADEAILEDIQAMAPRPPGAAPAGPAIIGEAPRDIERGLLNLMQPVNHWCKGNSIDGLVLANNAKQMAREITTHRKKIDTLMAANTVDSDLKRQVILTDLMRAFKRRLVIMNAFSTHYNVVPLLGTDEVVVPFFELDTTTSTDFSNANGYLFTENTDAGKRKVTVNKRKYKSFQFSSEEFRRQPYFNAPVSLTLKAEQLALDIWTDVLSVIDQATYGNPVLEIEPANIDVDDIITIRKVCEQADWPVLGRNLVLGSDHEAALLSDETLKHFLNVNSTDPLREGATGRLLGFNTYYSPRIPTNGEGLTGFACIPDSVLCVTSPIAPAPGVRSLLLSYNLVIDPDTGMSFEYRYWGEPQADKDREIVECNYGFKNGNASALKRITDGNVAYSSSSSASSASTVNSSSSSSSQS